MIQVDTNYLVRFFTNDIKLQARRAREVISTKNVIISDIVLAETIYILEEHYESKKIDTCRLMPALLKQKNIKSNPHAILSFKIYKNENISYYDSLLVSEALCRGSTLKTFDQKLQKVFKKYSEAVK